MRTIDSLTALGAACLLAVSFGTVANAQLPQTCIAGVDSGCPYSEVPVPGVRIVRPEDHHRRPAHFMSGDRYVTLSTVRETRNTTTLIDMYVPPGGGPVPHVHAQEWEIFF